MKRKYYDAIKAKADIVIKVNPRVAHFLDEEEKISKILTEKEIRKLKPKQQERYYQNEFENSHCSLNKLLDNGFQPSSNYTIEDEIEKREREERYFNSSEYQRFISSFREEIRKTMIIMPFMVRKAMFLRFFKNMSISKIAEELGCHKATAQTYLSRGSGYMRYFLDEDIKEQDKRDRLKKMKVEQQKFKYHK